MGDKRSDAVWFSSACSKRGVAQFASWTEGLSLDEIEAIERQLRDHALRDDIGQLIENGSPESRRVKLSPEIKWERWGPWGTGVLRTRLSSKAMRRAGRPKDEVRAARERERAILNETAARSSDARPPHDRTRQAA